MVHPLIRLIPVQTNALGIGADTGHVLKACRRMSRKPGPQGNALANSVMNLTPRAPRATLLRAGILQLR